MCFLSLSILFTPLFDDQWTELPSIFVDRVDPARVSDSLLAPAADRAPDERERTGRGSIGEGTCSYSAAYINAPQSLAFSCLLRVPCVMEA